MDPDQLAQLAQMWGFDPSKVDLSQLNIGQAPQPTNVTVVPKSSPSTYAGEGIPPDFYSAQSYATGPAQMPQGNQWLQPPVPRDNAKIQDEDSVDALWGQSTYGLVPWLDAPAKAAPYSAEGNLEQGRNLDRQSIIDKGISTQQAQAYNARNKYLVDELGNPLMPSIDTESTGPIKHTEKEREEQGKHLREMIDRGILTVASPWGGMIAAQGAVSSGRDAIEAYNRGDPVGTATGFANTLANAGLIGPGMREGGAGAIVKPREIMDALRRPEEVPDYSMRSTPTSEFTKGAGPSIGQMPWETETVLGSNKPKFPREEQEPNSLIMAEFEKRNAGLYADYQKDLSDIFEGEGKPYTKRSGEEMALSHEGQQKVYDRTEKFNDDLEDLEKQHTVTQNLAKTTSDTYLGMNRGRVGWPPKDDYMTPGAFPSRQEAAPTISDPWLNAPSGGTRPSLESLDNAYRGHAAGTVTPDALNAAYESARQDLETAYPRNKPKAERMLDEVAKANNYGIRNEGTTLRSGFGDPFVPDRNKGPKNQPNNYAATEPKWSQVYPGWKDLQQWQKDEIGQRWRAQNKEAFYKANAEKFPEHLQTIANSTDPEKVQDSLNRSIATREAPADQRNYLSKLHSYLFRGANGDISNPIVRAYRQQTGDRFNQDVPIDQLYNRYQKIAKDIEKEGQTEKKSAPNFYVKDRTSFEKHLHTFGRREGEEFPEGEVPSNPAPWIIKGDRVSLSPYVPGRQE